MSMPQLIESPDHLARRARHLPGVDDPRPASQSPVVPLLGGAGRPGLAQRSTARVPNQAAILQMQRTVGNRAVQRMLQPSTSSSAIQRCGATPCNCSPEEKAQHALEASPEAAEAVSTVAAMPAARQEALAQRLADSKGGPALMERLAEPGQGLAIQRGFFDDEDEGESDDPGSSVLDWAGEQAGGAADWVGEQAGGAADWVGEQAGGAADWVGEQAGGAADWVSEQAGGAVDWVSEQGGAAADWLAEQGAAVAGEDFDPARGDTDDGSGAAKSAGREECIKDAESEHWKCAKAANTGCSVAGGKVGGPVGGFVYGVCEAVVTSKCDDRKSEQVDKCRMEPAKKGVAAAAGRAAGKIRAPSPSEVKFDELPDAPVKFDELPDAP